MVPIAILSKNQCASRPLNFENLDMQYMIRDESCDITWMFAWICCRIEIETV